MKLIQSLLKLWAAAFHLCSFLHKTTTEQLQVHSAEIILLFRQFPILLLYLRTYSNDSAFQPEPSGRVSLSRSAEFNQTTQRKTAPVKRQVFIEVVFYACKYTWTCFGPLDSPAVAPQIRRRTRNIWILDGAGFVWTCWINNIRVSPPNNTLSSPPPGWSLQPGGGRRQPPNQPIGI